MPHLKTLVERHKDDPFVLLGINFRDSAEAYHKGVKDFGVSWLSAFEGSNSTIVDLYSVTGFPTYLVLDVDGKIVHRGHNPEAIDEVIAELLAKVKK